MHEQGHSLLDVLAAMAIIGFISISVWQAHSRGYATLSQARQQSYLAMLSASTIYALECGANNQISGEITPPRPLQSGHWQVDQTPTGATFAVRWTDKSGQRGFYFHGFFIP